MLWKWFTCLEHFGNAETANCASQKNHKFSSVCMLESKVESFTTVGAIVLPFLANFSLSSLCFFLTVNILNHICLCSFSGTPRFLASTVETLQMRVEPPRVVVV